MGPCSVSGLVFVGLILLLLILSVICEKQSKNKKGQKVKEFSECSIFGWWVVSAIFTIFSFLFVVMFAADGCD